ncbi:Retrovirus-related Pol polyprotein from transposon 17.6 [Glycine soja]
MASTPSFLSKAHLGGEAPSSMAYSLVDGASSHLFSFVFRYISMLKDPASIEAPQASFHQVVIRAQELQFHLPFVFKPPTRKNHNLGTNMSHYSTSVNGKGTSHKDPLSRILDELSSLNHNSCKSLSEELRDYYEGRHRSHLRPHSHRREKERKPQEANINLSYFHGKDNEIRVEQQLKKMSTSKSYGSHSYPKKDQGQGILGVTPSKPKDDKGKTIEKQAPKASMQEKTSSIKCFKCLGRGHIASQCPTTKTMIMRDQDIYSSQDKATTSPSSSESEEAKGEESSEEIYPQEEGQPLVVKEKCKEVSIIRHQVHKIGGMMNVLNGATLFCKITRAPNIFMVCVHRDPLGSFNTNLGTHMGHLRNNQYENTEKGMFYCVTFLNFSNSDQGVFMNPKRIKVIPKWPTPSSIRKIWGFHDLTNFYKRFVPYFSILVEPLIELVRNRVEGRNPEYEKPRDLRSNPF